MRLLVKPDLKPLCLGGQFHTVRLGHRKVLVIFLILK